MKESSADSEITFQELESSLKAYIACEYKREKLLHKLRSQYKDAKILMYHQTIGVVLIDRKEHMYFGYAKKLRGDKFDFHRGVVIALCKILNPRKKKSKLAVDLELA